MDCRGVDVCVGSFCTCEKLASQVARPYDLGLAGRNCDSFKKSSRLVAADFLKQARLPLDPAGSISPGEFLHFLYGHPVEVALYRMFEG